MEAIINFWKGKAGSTLTRLRWREEKIWVKLECDHQKWTARQYNWCCRGRQGHGRVSHQQMESTRKTNTFLEASSPPSLTHEEIQSANRPKQKPRIGVCPIDHGKKSFTNLSKRSMMREPFQIHPSQQSQRRESPGSCWPVFLGGHWSKDPWQTPEG